MPHLSAKLLAILLKPMLPGRNMALKFAVLASTLMLTHKSSNDKHLVAFKLIPKTSKFDFFNHHLSHPQAHSSSKKCVHLNHPHHHHSESNNKHHLFLNHPHSFSVNVHHNHQQFKDHKLLFAIFLLWLFHHDLSSLNVSQLLHPVHVISSSNDGFHMVLLLNEKPLFNELLLPKVMLLHETSSFNTKMLKSALFVNSNA